MTFVIFVARNNRKLVDVAQESYSFPGSAWERIGVEAPASLVHKRRMHFGDAEPRLHSSYQAEPQSLVTDCTVQQNLQSVPLGRCQTAARPNIESRLFISCFKNAKLNVSQSNFRRSSGVKLERNDPSHRPLWIVKFDA